MRKETLVLMFAIVLVAGIFIAATSQTAAQCLTTGDLNGDSVLTVSGDLVPLSRFINFAGPPPVPLYLGDLNGDCAIDQADLELYGCYFVYGLSCFPQYPIVTCCDPDTLRGACCDSLGNCSVRTEGNCLATGGTYHGDGTTCTVGSHCKLCGDLNEDGMVNISNVVYLVLCVFMCDPIPQQAEVNCDGIINISDVVYLINYIFAAGPAPCATCK